MGYVVLFLLALIVLVVLASRPHPKKSGAKHAAPGRQTRRTTVRTSPTHRSSGGARDAFLSGDLQRMMGALGTPAKPVDRHFLLMTIVRETYRLRSDPLMAQKCMEVAEVHINEFPKIKAALVREFGSLPRVPTFQHYATLLTERGAFERAEEVCRRAIGFGLVDGTKGGYEGRIKRIQKKAARAAQEGHPKAAHKTRHVMPSAADESKALQVTESFSEPHRQRRKRAHTRPLDLENLPFVSLPRAPNRWEDGDAAAGSELVAADGLFELLGSPAWELSSPTKLPMEDRPDTAYRRHFSTQSGTFLIDDRGKAKSHPGCPAAALSFDASGKRLAERGLSWGLYRMQANPMGRGFVGISNNHVLHCYDERLRTLVAVPLADTLELQAARSRLGIADHELHRHIRTGALRPDGGAYLFSVVDEAFAIDMNAQVIWGVQMPQQDGWERVGAMTALSGTSSDVARAMERLSLAYPFAAADVKRQYRTLAKQWHPDKNPGREHEAAAEFRNVTAAAELLSGLDVSEFASPNERALYKKIIGPETQIELGDTGLSFTIEMSMGGDERSVADWIYAASFSANGGAFLAGYSGKIVELDHNGQATRLFDTGTVPRRIADTGDYLYFLTDTRLYVIRGTTLCRVVDVYGKGELVVGQTGFGLLGAKTFRWHTEDGEFVGGVRTKDPLRRVYPTRDGWRVETRQHRAELTGVPQWLE